MVGGGEQPCYTLFKIAQCLVCKGNNVSDKGSMFVCKRCNGAGKFDTQELYTTQPQTFERQLAHVSIQQGLVTYLLTMTQVVSIEAVPVFASSCHGPSACDTWRASSQVAIQLCVHCCLE